MGFSKKALQESALRVTQKWSKRKLDFDTAGLTRDELDVLFNEWARKKGLVYGPSGKVDLSRLGPEFKGVVLGIGDHSDATLLWTYSIIGQGVWQWKHRTPDVAIEGYLKEKEDQREKERARLEAEEEKKREKERKRLEAEERKERSRANQGVGEMVLALENLSRLPAHRNLAQKAIDDLEHRRPLSEDQRKAIRHSLYRSGMKPLADLFR